MTLPLHHSGSASEAIAPGALQISTRRVMVHAGLGERYVATAIDLLLLIALSPLVLGALAVFLRGWWPVGALVAALIYLAMTWAGGQSIGMRAAGIRLVCVRSARAPGMGRAFVRAALLLPPVVAALVLADAGGRALEGLDRRGMVVRFDFHHHAEPVADIDRAGVFGADLGQDALTPGGEESEERLAVLVAAVFAPEGAEHAQFYFGRFAAEPFDQKVIFLTAEGDGIEGFLVNGHRKSVQARFTTGQHQRRG